MRRNYRLEWLGIAGWFASEYATGHANFTLALDMPLCPTKPRPHCIPINQHQHDGVRADALGVDDEGFHRAGGSWDVGDEFDHALSPVWLSR